MLVLDTYIDYHKYNNINRDIQLKTKLQCIKSQAQSIFSWSNKEETKICTILLLEMLKFAGFNNLIVNIKISCDMSYNIDEKQVYYWTGDSYKVLSDSECQQLIAEIILFCNCMLEPCY